MRLLVSCVVRRASIPSISGGLLFLVTNGVVEQIQEYSGALRGISRDPATGLIHVANEDRTITVWDPSEWKQVDLVRLQEPAGALHQIRFYNGRLYASSAGADALHVIHPDGTQQVTRIHDRIPPETWGQIMVTCSANHARHPVGSDRLHFNSIAWSPAGEQHHVYNAARCIYNWTANQIVWADVSLDGIHDLVFAGGDLLTNVSCAGSLVEVYSRTVIDVWEGGLGVNPNNYLGFTRGLAKIADDCVVAGRTPNELRFYLRQAGVWSHTETVVLPGGNELSPYDICVLED